MNRYYFLVPSLPPLRFPQKPDIDWQDFLSRLQVNLSARAMKQPQRLRRFVDVCNIRALFLGEPLDPTGNLTEKELDEALLVRADLPVYVFDFLDQYGTREEQLMHFPGLLALFFLKESEEASGFLKRYFAFERAWRLVGAALRAKQVGRSFIREFQFEDPKDPFVAHILAQKDAAQYDPPEEYREIKEVLVACKGDPWMEERYFTEYRLRQIDELLGMEQFSLDAVLGYMAKLMLIEAYFALEEEKGRWIIERMHAG